MQMVCAVNELTETPVALAMEICYLGETFWINKTWQLEQLNNNLSLFRLDLWDIPSA